MDKISVDPDGTRNRQYHFTTQGYLANEVSVRADQDKRTLGQILRQKLKEVKRKLTMKLSSIQKISISFANKRWWYWVFVL